MSFVTKALPLLKAQPTPKESSNFSHAYPHLFTVQCNVTQNPCAHLWPALASILVTKGFTGHDSITLELLHTLRFPHLSVKISFYTSDSQYIDEHKWK
jgi:hypothetical protein